MASVLKWFGAKARNYVLSRVDIALRNAGKAWVAEARELAPVDTGFLRSSIGYAYDTSRRKLTLYCNASYAIWQEYGGYKTKAHPFMRPALTAISRFLRGSAVLQLSETPEEYQAHAGDHAKENSPGGRVEVGRGDFE